MPTLLGLLALLALLLAVVAAWKPQALPIAVALLAIAVLIDVWPR